MSEKLSEEKKKINPMAKLPFLARLIYFGLFLTLLTPLIVNENFYFPFVGPKSLFFMGLTEIVFFLWLLLIWKNRRYRPKINPLILVLILFLLVMSLSSLLGTNFSQSFWSKFERMTGLLMWFHLFAFFLVISSVFKTIKDWKKFFIVSIIVAFLVSLVAFLEIAQVKPFIISPQQGATLGNTSFLGVYLLFNIFFALWLFFQEKKWHWKICFLISIIFSFLIIFLSKAQAVLFCVLGGWGLLFLFWLSSKTKLKRLGRIFLIISGILVLSGLILVFQPGNFIYDYLEKIIKPRYINWEIAWQGFLERPLLGWGPENYALYFPKLFNPCFFTPECGGEIWFDRTHNIIFDTLFSLGILGFLGYLGIFAALFYILIKKYFKEQVIDFWTFSIFTILPIAYFIQNLTVFDMVSSFLMFFLVLGFGGFLAGLKKEEERSILGSVNKERLAWWQSVFLFLIFLFPFFHFVSQPLKTDGLIIKSINPKISSSERISVYQKTLQASPLGKHQIREYFSQHSEDVIRLGLSQLFSASDETNKRKIIAEIEKELNFVIDELKKTEEEMPLDYRAVIKLAGLYNFYALIKPAKIYLAEEYGEKALRLSPKNQTGYWLLAQSKVYQKDFKKAQELTEKAIELEPKHFPAHLIAIRASQYAGDFEKVKELIQRAIRINPAWEKELKKRIGKNI